MKKQISTLLMVAFATTAWGNPDEVIISHIAPPKEASAEVDPVPGNSLKGRVTFTDVDNGVKIVGDFTGLTPGKHGFHVHEHGECSGDFNSAGGHFNPTRKKHGGPDSAERHVGDLGNIEADESGNAHYERVDTIISLSGSNSIVGKTIMIHAKEDDLKTDPSGNSGVRIGCGVIKAKE